MVPFTEEILNGKLHFICNDNYLRNLLVNERFIVWSNVSFFCESQQKHFIYIWVKNMIFCFVSKKSYLKLPLFCFYSHYFFSLRAITNLKAMLISLRYISAIYNLEIIIFILTIFSVSAYSILISSDTPRSISLLLFQ